MLVLTLRTDKPEAELCLFDGQNRLAYFSWQAHRRLAETVHQKISEMLKDQEKRLQDLQAVIVFQGPGSFTGLRIGISVANALADSLKIPIAGKTGGQWIDQGIDTLLAGADDKIVVPEYGAPVKVTAPRK